MRVSSVIACFFLIGLLSAQAQTSGQTIAAGPQTSEQKVVPSAQQAKIDPAKEADIRRLLDLVDIKAVIKQTIDRMSGNLKPLLANSMPPGDYREKLVDLFFAKFLAKADLQHLLDLAVPVYDKYFSHEEIKGLIRFYETPLGQKAAVVFPQIAVEMSNEGRKWGEVLGREAMAEVLAEHPDLAAAAAAARKANQPQ